MREVKEQGEPARAATGIASAGLATRGPNTVPRVDYERIFVLDGRTNLLGEYALDDDCPIESSDLMRSMPLSGLRHLVSFYQGEYAFTPFKVDDLWFVVLTRGVPRIEERGSFGTVLAAARIHIPPMLEPLLAKRETDLRLREQEMAQRESALTRREERVATQEGEIGLALASVKELEADLRLREAKIVTLRDYAVQIQRTFVPPKEEKAKDVPAPPPGPAASA
jgi:hypothetical protein